MNGSTINILDKAKANELKRLGFNYTTQRISDNKFVYVFINSPELAEILSTGFAANNYFVGRTLNF